MNSSRKPEATRVPKPAPLLVADAGLPYAVAAAEPIDAWLDLMETIEALGPRPRASTPARNKDYRL